MMEASPSPERNLAILVFFGYLDSLAYLSTVFAHILFSSSTTFLGGTFTDWAWEYSKCDIFSLFEEKDCTGKGGRTFSFSRFPSIYLSIYLSTSLLIFVSRYRLSS